MPLKTKLILLYFLFTYTHAFTQTIINAERSVDTTKTNIYSLKFAYNGNSGNLETSELNIAPTYILLKKKNEFRLFGSYSILSTNGSIINNSGYAHIRHNYKLAERLKTFEFYQIQNNNTLLLEKRVVYGGGLRYSFIKKDSLSLDMELGLMQEIENRKKDKLLPNDDAEVSSYRITNAYSYKYIINSLVSIRNVTYYQPNIQAFDNYRVLNDFNLIVTLTNLMSLIAEINTRYDSKAPANLKPIDNSVRIGFSFSFAK